VIQFKVLFCTYTQNLSQLPQSWAKLRLFFENPRRWPTPYRFCKNDDFGYYSVSFGTSVSNLVRMRPSTA